MRLAKRLSACGMVVMTAALIYGFTVGNFASDGATLLRNPWGVVSIVDLYTGFTLFSAWVVFRENSRIHALLWVVLIMAFGFFSASAYTFFALRSSEGNWQRFWMGQKADG